MTTFGVFAMDNFIGSEMSTFTQASIRDLAATSSQQEHWVGNYILNSLDGSFVSPHRQSVYYFLRRTQAAFDEWGLAREAALTYLETPGQRPLLYVKAIGHWEAVLSYLWQAHLLIRKDGWFKSKDGSVHQRLHHLYNTAKHAEGSITAGRCIPDAPLVVWLTNSGLRAIDGKITFDELADVLEGLGQSAAALQDPLTAVDGRGNPAPWHGFRSR